MSFGPPEARRALSTLAAILLLATPGWAAVLDCSNPDNLCTGDPCVIPEAEVSNPCVVDFGERDVVIEGITGFGLLDLRARSFRADGPLRSSSGVAFEKQAIFTATDSITLTAPVKIASLCCYSADLALVLVAGGDVSIEETDGGAGPVAVTGTLHAWSNVQARSSADVLVAGKIRVRTAHSPRIVVASGSTATLRGSFRMGGIDPVLDVSGAAVEVSSANFKTKARPQELRGLQRFVATSGDVDLSGTFTSDVIEGTAAGDFTAAGKFRVGGQGCIALSAGGTLDTAAASFDSPVVSDCP